MAKVPFNVSARTAKLIGQENFANAEGAVIELIKNSYDADSSIVILIVDIISDTFYILDNGDGMSTEIIRNNWMTIGTDEKRSNSLSKGSRVRTGAKGIGRFALDRLGKRCRMYTRTESSNTIFWEVDWSEFEKSNTVITQVKAELKELEEGALIKRLKEIFKETNTESKWLDNWSKEKGVLLEITGLKDNWDKKSIQSLSNNIASLVPASLNHTFSIYLVDPSDTETFAKIESAIIDDFDYKVTAIVDAEQNVKIRVDRNELNVHDLSRLLFFDKTQLKEDVYKQKVFESGFFEINRTLDNLLSGFKLIDKYDNLSKIGPFDFTFCFFKRGGGQEKKSEGLTKYPYKNVNYALRTQWLDKFGGIKIFRDNFRVRPYGETNSSSFDWLDLGKRALSNPTVTRPGYRVRPQQMYGALNISRIDNVNFDDKSSREGLQENDVFMVLKEILIAIIGIFENDRNQIMMSLKKIFDDTNEREKAKKEADDYIKEQENTSDKNDEWEKRERAYKKAIEAYKEEQDDLVEEQKLLRVLSSTGLIVTSFAHELKNLSDTIELRTEHLSKILPKLIDPELLQKQQDYLNPFIILEDFKSQDVKIKHWLDFSLSSIKKDKRQRKSINLAAYTSMLERSWSEAFSRKKIDFSITIGTGVDEFYGMEIDLDSIFHNLIVNSIDAFKRKNAGNQRRIAVGIVSKPNNNANTIEITHSDSGPGLDKSIIDPNQIFLPFFTTKRDEKTGEKTGTGLGLWIVKSVVDEYHGNIQVAADSSGVRFVITLPKNRKK